MLARISAVQQRMGASRLTEASPVAQADVVRPELAAERHEFLVDKRLDRAGIDGALALGQGLEMQRGRDQRFARAGGRVEDDVFFLEQLEDGRFLRRVKPELPRFGVFEKPGEQRVIVRPLVLRDQIVKSFRHGALLIIGH